MDQTQAASLSRIHVERCERELAMAAAARNDVARRSHYDLAAMHAAKAAEFGAVPLATPSAEAAIRRADAMGRTGFGPEPGVDAVVASVATSSRGVA